MPDLRNVYPADNTSAEAVLSAAKLKSGEYLSAFWRKRTTGGMVSANITTNTAARLAYILRMMKAKGCTELSFVVTTHPDRDINPQSTDGLSEIYFFGA